MLNAIDLISRNHPTNKCRIYDVDSFVAKFLCRRSRTPNVRALLVFTALIVSAASYAMAFLAFGD